MKTRPTPKERLIELLASEGYVVTDMFYAAGYWKHADCYRWSAWANRNGITYSLDSWDTITKCAKEGIVISDKTDNYIPSYTSKEVWAKSSVTAQPKPEQP